MPHTGEMFAAIRAWMECPAERRPTARALGQRIEEIAAALPIDRGYHDCIECGDGKRECTCGGPSVTRPHLSTPEK